MLSTPPLSLRKLWKGIGKAHGWGHPRAPAGKWLWKEKSTEAVLFCFDSCISIPLHGARRAMAAALPLLPAGQRRHFRGISARPGPACAVIVGLPPSAQKQKRKAKEKAHDAPRRKQKKTNCRPPRPPTPPSPPGRLPTPFQPPRCPSNTAVSGGRKISY